MLRIIFSIALGLIITSCTDDTNAFIQKIETTQTELKKQDSVLVSYRTELSSIAFMDTSRTTGPTDSLLNGLLQQTNQLITRLELMIEKNKAIVEQVKTNAGDSKEVEKEYAAQLDELELIKPGITSAKSGYDKLMIKINENLNSHNDSIKVK